MTNNNEKEFQRWFKQAKYDFKSARDSFKSENYEWSCFQSQQSAEKTLKAFLHLKGERQVLSHSVSILLKMCLKHEKKFETIRNCGSLDKYYIPTRYPNSLPELVPHEFYTKEDAEKCVDFAKRIISLIEKLTKK